MADPTVLQNVSTVVETEASLLEKILIEGRLAPTADDRESATELLGEWMSTLTRDIKVILTPKPAQRGDCGD